MKQLYCEKNAINAFTSDTSFYFRFATVSSKAVLAIFLSVNKEEMQRILSIEAASRSCNTGTEVVSKRLCFSCSLSIAFLALIGGFALGQYTAQNILNKRHESTKVDESGSVDVFCQSFLQFLNDDRLQSSVNDSLNDDCRLLITDCERLSMEKQPSPKIAFHQLWQLLRTRNESIVKCLDARVNQTLLKT